MDFFCHCPGWTSGHKFLTERLCRLGIALLNVDYKILTNLFAKRLGKFLLDLLYQYQKGLIAEKFIHENLLDTQAMLSTCDRFNREGLLILLNVPLL